LRQLETGLRAPVASYMLSYGALKLFPVWDPLRGDPRFEKIVASLAPKQWGENFRTTSAFIPALRERGSILRNLHLASLSTC
jgi:hypothetical protein